MGSILSKFEKSIGLEYHIHIAKIVGGKNCIVDLIDENSGVVRIGKNTKIGKIVKNQSIIQIEGNSAISAIEKGTGVICIGLNCEISKIVDNQGFVMAGPVCRLPIPKGKSYSAYISLENSPVEKMLHEMNYWAQKTSSLTPE